MDVKRLRDVLHFNTWQFAQANSGFALNSAVYLFVVLGPAFGI
jgi:hypothetical protein